MNKNELWLRSCHSTLTRVSHVLLEADASGYRIEHRQAAYDRAAVIARFEALRHPGRDYITRFMRGERIRDWPLLP